MSLKGNLTVALYILGILALIASLSLIAFTTYMSDAVTTLADALRSVYLAQRAEIDLLVHARSVNPVSKALLEEDLRQKLEEAKQYAEAPREMEILSNAEKQVSAYFDRSHTSGDGLQNLLEFEPAVDSLREVADINLSHADAAQLEAQRLDRVGDRVGITVAVLLIAGVAAVSIWLVAFAFRYVFSIRDAMRDFARGDRTARAVESGPAELRNIASQFNAMADSLIRQRENQLAFLAGVAHDLRNPLSVLKLSTMFVSSRPPQLGEQQIQELTTTMKRQVDYLDRMIGDLLDASRIEAGHLELCPEQQDARTLVEQVFELFRNLSSTHELSCSLPDEPVLLYCDPLRIEQVLNNLVSNAIKYSPKGGPVGIRLNQFADEAVIAVSDQGMGIPPDQRHHVFEPFRRAHLAKEEIPGIGLGLSVARRIVEAHHGRIDCESEVGRGTTFYVHLPRQAGAAAA
jgi:two-component system, OmpR family, sensor histidine kinase MtrB